MQSWGGDETTHLFSQDDRKPTNNTWGLAVKAEKDIPSLKFITILFHDNVFVILDFHGFSEIYLEGGE